jgi:hypothetical protein
LFQKRETLSIQYPKEDFNDSINSSFTAWYRGNLERHEPLGLDLGKFASIVPAIRAVWLEIVLDNLREGRREPFKAERKILRFLQCSVRIGIAFRLVEEKEISIILRVGCSAVSNASRRERDRDFTIEQDAPACIADQIAWRAAVSKSGRLKKLNGRGAQGMKVHCMVCGQCFEYRYFFKIWL